MKRILSLSVALSLCCGPLESAPSDHLAPRSWVGEPEILEVLQQKADQEEYQDRQAELVPPTAGRAAARSEDSGSTRSRLRSEGRSKSQ